MSSRTQSAVAPPARLLSWFAVLYCVPVRPAPFSILNNFLDEQSLNFTHGHFLLAFRTGRPSDLLISAGQTSRPHPLYQIPWQEPFAAHPPCPQVICVRPTYHSPQQYSNSVILRTPTSVLSGGDPRRRPVADFRLFGRQLAMFTRFMT